MADNFKYLERGLEAPAFDASAVTPSDTTDLSSVSRALYVGGAGNVTVVMQSGSTVTFWSVPAGTILPVRASRVNAASTTATKILALE